MFRKYIFYVLGFLAGLYLAFFKGNHQIVEFISSTFHKELNSFFWSEGLQLFGLELALVCLLIFIGDFIKNKKIAAALFPMGFVLLFFFVLYGQIVNAPINDDIFTVFGFANAWHDAGSFSQKLDVLFSFHSECRLVFTKLFILFFNTISGLINIRTMLLFSNSCLLFVFFFFRKRSSFTLDRRYLLITLSALLFQFSYYDTITWFTDALHYQFTVLFFMCFLYFLGGQKNFSVALSVLFAVLATFTFGNGLLAFPIAIIYCLLNRNYRQLLVWALVLIATAIFYFRGFPFGQTEFDMSDVWKLPAYSFCFIGGSLQFFQSLFLPFAIGLLVWILLLVLVQKKYYKKNFFVFGLILFVCLSSLVAGVFRIKFGVSEAISNRYGFFSILAILSSVIALAEISSSLKQIKILKAAAISSVIFYLMSALFFYPEVPVRRQKLEKFVSDFKAGNAFVVVEPILPAGTDSIVKESAKRSLYFP